MKRALALLVVPFLFACADTPTLSPTEPSLSTSAPFTIGAVGPVTWTFTAQVNWVGGAPAGPIAIGDGVKASLFFTPEPFDPPSLLCSWAYWGTVTGSFTINGVVYDGTGVGVVQTNVCDSPGYVLHFYRRIPGDEMKPASWDLQVTPVAASLDFPWLAPPLDAGAFGVTDPRYGWFTSILGPAGPTEKADCLNGGWEGFHFKNQGQCVRYVETGKDSR